VFCFFFFSSRRRHTRWPRDWSSDVCSSDLGLGKSAKIVRLEVWWPASNSRQSFAHVDKNQFIEIKEFAKDYTRPSRKQLRLGSSNPFKAGSARSSGLNPR